MANGFRPFRDIYSPQGVLLLDLLYPFYALFGGSLGAIRLGVGLLSMLGLLGAWWVGRQAAGSAGGLVAAFLLGASPAYLEGSRLALAEVPSLVPGLWAIGCGLRWQRGAGLDLRRSFKLVLADRFHSQPGLFILAAVGTPLLLVADWRRGLAVISWALVAGGMLLVSSPLHPTHLVYLSVPLTLAAGAGL